MTAGSTFKLQTTYTSFIRPTLVLRPVSLVLSHSLLTHLFPCLDMSKNTAKKRAAGGCARRISAPLGSPAVSPAPASPSSPEEDEVVQPDTHSPVSPLLQCLPLLIVR